MKNLIFVLGTMFAFATPRFFAEEGSSAPEGDEHVDATPTLSDDEVQAIMEAVEPTAEMMEEAEIVSDFAIDSTVSN